MSGLTITGATVIDPVDGTVEKRSLFIDGTVLNADQAEFAEPIDGNGLHAAPGIVDLGCHAIERGAFVAGGITRAALMPGQSPVFDNPALVQRAAVSGKPDIWVHPVAAATHGLAGEKIAEIGLMKDAGAVAVGTGRTRIANSSVMLNVLRYAAALDMVVISHPEDESLVSGAVATEGEQSTRLGLPSAPSIAEPIAISRDLMLAEQADAHIHFHQVTTARGFDLIREAKARGIKVTCGVSPAHLLLCDVDIGPYRTFAKLSPPLRSADDRDAARAALADGTIDVITSAHDPHGTEAKRQPYVDAEPGEAGAETLLTLSLILVRDGLITLPRLFNLLSYTPARILDVPGGRMATGDVADIILFDLDAPWKLESETMASRAGNTPFDELPMQGRVVKTVKGGRILDPTAL